MKKFCKLIAICSEKQVENERLNNYRVAYDKNKEIPSGVDRFISTSEMFYTADNQWRMLENGENKDDTNLSEKLLNCP